MKKSKRITWDASRVSKLGLGNADAKYLTEVGLPEIADWTLTLLEEPLAGETAFITVARDDVHAIGFERGTGHVVIHEEERVRFVSSTLPLFGRALDLFASYRREVRGLPEEKALKKVEAFAKAMTAADEAALEDESYWALSLEQMRDGLL